MLSSPSAILFDIGQDGDDAGIVSATGRHGYGINGVESTPSEDFIQTDAAINPGNSGGALRGCRRPGFVGINTAIVGSSGGNQGIGFVVVPINMALPLRRTPSSAAAKFTRGLIGAFSFPQDITPNLAQAFNLPDENGALIGNVTPNMPADKAGIKIR